MARAQTIRLSLSHWIVSEARKYAVVDERTGSNQLEHWARIGKVAEENPDLPYSFVRETFFALEEAKTESLEEYEFG
ncbi:MAG: hypothetical protein Ta2A_25950 [Treponemataceae bacterium]|nr:MAG: hypothetical protein Ta2A_25950 [Treponemataceae bacterium]